MSLMSIYYDEIKLRFDHIHHIVLYPPSNDPLTKGVAIEVPYSKIVNRSIAEVLKEIPRLEGSIIEKELVDGGVFTDLNDLLMRLAKVGFYFKGVPWSSEPITFVRNRCVLSPSLLMRTITAATVLSTIVLGVCGVFRTEGLEVVMGVLTLVAIAMMSSLKSRCLINKRELRNIISLQRLNRAVRYKTIVKRKFGLKAQPKYWMLYRGWREKGRVSSAMQK